MSFRINRKTSFHWRHRFLALIAKDHPNVLHGITEADETYLLESQKGSRHLSRKPRKRGGKASRPGLSREQVCILIARDRVGCTVDFVTDFGPVSTSSLKGNLKPVLDTDVLLVTDEYTAYRTFCQAEKISHEVVNISKGERVKELSTSKMLMPITADLKPGYNGFMVLPQGSFPFRC